MRLRRPAPAARDRARAPEERGLSLPAARFVGSFPRADIPLDPPLPELALIGRSNVGKSSLVNALAGRRIAKVSGTPGKTRSLNVYELHVSRLPSSVSLYMLDLPGYGYAAVSKTERAAVRRLIGASLDRPHLAGVLWLLDLRREPSADDHAMQELFAAKGTRVLAALTKSDTLARSERLRRERVLGDALALERDQLVVTSARAGEGIAELREAVEHLVAR